MKADERSATNGNPRRTARHHVMVAGTVVALFMSNRSNHGELVRAGGQAWQCFAKLNAGNLGGNRRQLPADLGRRIWLRVEGFEMRRATVQPNQNAALGRRTNSGRRSLGRMRTQPQEFGQSGSDERPQT